MPRSKDFAIHKTDDQAEAFAYFASFVLFVLTHWRSPLTWVTGALLGVNVFSLQDYVRSDKVDVEVRKPLSANTSFSLMPEAFAQEKGKVKENAIVINKQLWGYFDPDFECWKLIDEPTVLVHQKSTGLVVGVATKKLQTEQMKSLKR